MGLLNFAQDLHESNSMSALIVVVVPGLRYPLVHWGVSRFRRNSMKV
jgi:hypothetical protein